MSVSQLKSFMDCEARALAELNGLIPKQDNKAFLEGKYLHAWSEGKLDEFTKEHLEIYKYNNPKKGKLKTFEDIDTIISYIEQDENVMEMLEGEKEVIMTVEFLDVKWKFMIDVYNPRKGRIVDLKFINDIYKGFWNNDKKGYDNFVQYYKYDYQMVLYSLLEQLFTGRDEPLEPYIVAISKEVPPTKIILNGFLEDVSNIVQDVYLRLPRIIKVKNGELEPHYCGKCDYCRSVLKAETINYKELLIR